MISSLLQIPLIAAIIVSGYAFWRTGSSRVTNRALAALIFWGASYGVLYWPGFGSPQIAELSATFGPRFLGFVEFFEGNSVLAQVWLSAIFVDGTVSFTRTRASFPRRLAQALDVIAGVGVALVFWQYMSGNIPSV